MRASWTHKERAHRVAAIQTRVVCLEHDSHELFLIHRRGAKDPTAFANATVVGGAAKDVRTRTIKLPASSKQNGYELAHHSERHEQEYECNLCSSGHGPRYATRVPAQMARILHSCESSRVTFVAMLRRRHAIGGSGTSSRARRVANRQPLGCLRRIAVSLRSSLTGIMPKRLTRWGLASSPLAQVHDHSLGPHLDLPLRGVRASFSETAARQNARGHH